MPSHFKVVQRNVVFQYQSIFVMEMHLLLRVKGSKASDDPYLLEDIHFAVPEIHLIKNSSTKMYFCILSSSVLPRDLRYTLKISSRMLIILLDSLPPGQGAS